MPRITQRYGSPFHMVLGTGTATEDGKTLRSNEELFPVLGRFAHAFISSGLGLDAAGFANNAFGLLASTTEDGELRMLGTPGYMQAEFDGEVVVRRHFAPRAASLLLAPWVHADDHAEAGRRETESASMTHLDTDFVLLSHAQNDEAGNPYMEPFDKALASAWKRKAPTTREMPAALVAPHAAYKVRVMDALAKVEATLDESMGHYSTQVAGHATSLLEAVGPAAAAWLMTLALTRVDGILGTLTQQRDELTELVADAGSALSLALDDLEARVSKGGAFRRHRKEIRVVISLLTDVNGAGYALSLTGAAISALAAVRETVLTWHADLSALVSHMESAVFELDKAWSGYEQRTITPIDELVQRPLAAPSDLRALYENVTASGWDSASAPMTQAFRENVGRLKEWIGVGVVDIVERAVTAARPLFPDVLAMSADDLVRWLCHRRGVTPDVALRNLIELAPILCRYDRARLPESDGMYDGAFVLIGVPDRDTSVFTGTGQGVLVTTGDRRHISVLRLKLGMPASALWDFERMRAAYDAVRRRGEVVVDIYPELYAFTEHGANATPRTRGRRKGAANRKGRTR